MKLIIPYRDGSALSALLHDQQDEASAEIRNYICVRAECREEKAR